jgi:hypothetical protein
MASGLVHLQSERLLLELRLRLLAAPLLRGCLMWSGYTELTVSAFSTPATHTV